MNESLLEDARARRHYRTGATVAVAAVIGSLIWALFLVVCALIRNNAFVTGPAIGFAITLVVSIAVLAIALLRSTFAPTAKSDRGNKEADGPVITVTGIEALRALKDAVDLVFKGPSK